MLKSLFTAAWIAIALNTAIAQVHIQATIPTVGLVQKNQLWNLVLVNGTTTTVEGRLELVLRDRKNGTELFTATTGHIVLPKGSLSLNASALNPIQYNYLAMDPDRSIGGLLPAGAYLACFSFTRTYGEKQESVTQECVSFDTEPLSPPMLLFPADSAELDEMPAQFTWTPPTPAGMFDKLRYEVFITEVRPGQKAAEALQENMSFYNTAGLVNNFITYPASLPAFEKEKWYAWHIIALNGDNYAAKTESWVFKIRNPEPVNVPKVNATYLLMSDEVTGAYTISADKLRIKYKSPDADYETVIAISNEKGGLVRQVSQKVSPGDNYWEFDLDRHYTEGSVYTVTLTDPAKKRHVLLFSITKN